MVPDEYILTHPNIGGDDSADSDIDPNTGRSQMISLLPGQPNITLDIGLRPQPERTNPDTPTSLDEATEPNSLTPQIYLPLVE